MMFLGELGGRSCNFTALRRSGIAPRTVTAAVSLCVASLIFSAARIGSGAAPDAPSGEPVLRLDTGGPTSFVSSLVFGTDSQTLFAGGFDKVVLAWTRRNDQFEPDPNETLRFPIGPGLYGAINAVAVSADGRYLAVAGRGFVEGAAGFRQPGRILYTSGAMTKEMKRDEGTIYVVDSQTQLTHQLRGHLGPVVALTFAPEANGTFVLVSAAQETTPQSAELRAVLRLWDVGQRKHLRSTYVNLDEQGQFEQSVGYSAAKTPPGLAVRRTGSQPLDLQIAIAWNDGATRLWDPRSEPTGSLVTLAAEQSSPEGLRNCTIAYLPDGGMITAGSSGWSGQLHFWKPDADQLPRRSGDALSFSDNGLPLLPRAIAVFNRDATTYVAIASLTFARVPGRASRLEPEAVELRIVDLAQRRFVARQKLWAIDRVYGVPLPSLAVAPDSNWLAISGGPNHEIWLFPLSDLMGEQVRPQKLSSRTLNLNEGFFVRREGARGLCLQGEGSDSRFVYDLETRELKPLVRGMGWLYDRAQANDWDVQSQTVGQGAERQIVLRVRGPRGAQSEVRLPSEQEEVTATAVLPAGTNPPLLVVASHELGQPLLAVFHLESGEKLRHFTGHTERIRTLSASADGRLLISTAEDQTACVWSLTDLDAVLGRHAMLPGVAVEDAENSGLRVVRVDADSPAAGQLAVGDRILGRVDSGSLQEWSNAREFYDTWWLATPGTRVTLRRQRGPSEVRDVNLTLGQGVDERKPLFSFFVARPVEGRPFQWIGWSPLGPFDSSDEQIEQYLGWHFNTGDPERPTAFADLNQYRDQYFRAGLLSDLVTHGALLAPREPDPPPPPRMFLWIPEVGPAPEQADGQFVLRQRDSVTLALDLDSAFPDDLIQSIECQSDGQSLGEMQRRGDRRWEIDLSQVDWQRDARDLRVLLHTRERRPRVFEEDLRVRYQPPSPVIRLTNSELSKEATATLTQDKFTVRAQVLPGVEGEPFEVRLYELHPQERKLIDRWQLDQSAELELEVPLAVGIQHLQWEASNSRAPENWQALETSRESLKIIRTEPERPATPPQIALQVIAPSANAGALQYGQLLRCSSPRLELSGQITTEDPLEVATIQLSRDGLARPLSPVASTSNPNQFEFREILEDLPLEPTHFICFVRTRKGLSAEFYLQIQYTPPLPELVIVRPRVSERGMFLQEETATVEVEADLQFPDDSEVPESVLQQLRATVRGVGSEPQPAKVDSSERKLFAPIVVPSGSHQIQLSVHYAWNPDFRRESEPITVIGVPKPQVVRAELQRLEGKPTGELALDVQVDSDISRVYIGTQELTPASWMFDSARQLLQVLAPIPVASQEQVAVQVAGVAEPFRFPLPPVQTIVQPKTPPEVMFLSPARDISTEQSLLPVRFSLRSAKPITRVELRHNRLPLILWKEEDLQRRLVQAGQVYSFEDMITLSLESGNNSLELIAENADGPAKQSVMISVPDAPIRVEVRVTAADGAEITPSKSRDVDDPLVTVRGRIVFRDQKDPRISQEQLVKVWVGGFLQAVKYLEGAELGAVREFAVPVILSRRNNPIEVELPDLQHDVRDARQLQCEVRCLKPHDRYRLHLLVIGVGQRLNEEALIQDALHTLEATPQEDGPGRYRTPVFEDVEIYRPLVNESISAGTLNSRLGDIDRAIYTRKRENPDMQKARQDVVMVYYTGGELIASERQFYLTTKPNQDATDVVDYGISSERLRDFVEMNLGAHLLLLDVSRTCDKYCNAQTWPTTSHGAMLRFAWTNPQTPMPESAHLMNVMQQLDPARGELGQVEQQLKDHAARMNALIYDGLVPGSMQGLPLRGRLP